MNAKALLIDSRTLPPPLGLREELLYAAGSASNGIKGRGLSTFLLVFYNQVMGLPAAQVGFVIMIALAIDGFIDPLATPGAVDERALHALGMIYIPTMVVLYLGAIFCIRYYSINRLQHEENLEKLRRDKSVSAPR